MYSAAARNLPSGTNLSSRSCSLPAIPGKLYNTLDDARLRTVQIYMCGLATGSKPEKVGIQTVPFSYRR